MSGAADERARWHAELERVIQAEGIRAVDRVTVLSEAVSTQDTAFELAAGRPGLMVVAERQLAGRGRLGRPWVQGGNLGIAATFVLDGSAHPQEWLSLAGGVAAAWAAEEAVKVMLPEGAPAPLLGLRWPNDVVEGRVPGGGRKIAGVLIELRDGLALVGVGMNVGHRPEDFPEHLRSRAVSLLSVVEAHGGRRAPGRIAAARALVRAVDRVIRERECVAEWSRRDVLAGTERTFVHDGRAYSGRVEGIDPMHEITLVTQTGERVRLPARSTSLVQ